MYACLAVTCHLHFWQNDRDFLRATVVTRGWNGYRKKSQHRKSTLEKKILPPFQQGFEPATFQSRVRRSNHWAIPAPCMCEVYAIIDIPRKLSKAVRCSCWWCSMDSVYVGRPDCLSSALMSISRLFIPDEDVYCRNVESFFFFFLFWWTFHKSMCCPKRYIVLVDNRSHAFACFRTTLCNWHPVRVVRWRVYYMLEDLADIPHKLFKN